MAHATSAEFKHLSPLRPRSPLQLITILCLYPQHHNCSSTMESSIMFAHYIAASNAQQEIKYPSHAVVRADGRFPYRPKIVSGLHLRLSRRDRASAHELACHCQVCPRPERKYEAQIGLREMEEKANRTAPVQHKLMAKWALEVLASRAEAHFAHLRCPIAVMNCNLCRTSVAGTAVLDRGLTVTSTNPAAPYPTCSPMPRLRQTSRASGCLGDSPLEITAEVSLESPREFMR